MDGTLAAIFVIASLVDAGLRDCPDGCFAPQAAQSRLSVQLGQVIFQEDEIGEELYIGYDLDRKYGALQPTIGASVTDQGDAWIGFGAKWTSEIAFNSPFFVESSLMPGYYRASDGPDLGGNLQFRASLGAGYRFDNGGSILVSYDHRSNADTQDLNPGMETLAIRYAFAFD